MYRQPCIPEWTGASRLKCIHGCTWIHFSSRNFNGKELQQRFLRKGEGRDCVWGYANRRAAFALRLNSYTKSNIAWIAELISCREGSRGVIELFQEKYSRPVSQWSGRPRVPCTLTLHLCFSLFFPFSSAFLIFFLHSFLFYFSFVF